VRTGRAALVDTGCASAPKPLSFRLAPGR